MGRFEIDRNKEVQGILKLYALDSEVRTFIDELYFANYVEYKGKLRLAIRHNIDAINEFIENKDNKEE
jgi:hypothetical protein